MKDQDFSSDENLVSSEDRIFFESATKKKKKEKKMADSKISGYDVHRE